MLLKDFWREKIFGRYAARPLRPPPTHSYVHCQQDATKEALHDDDSPAQNIPEKRIHSPIYNIALRPTIADLAWYGNMIICKSFFVRSYVLIALGIASEALSLGPTTRRDALRGAASIFGGVVSSSSWIVSPNSASADDTAINNAASFMSYQILPDTSATLFPTLRPVKQFDLDKIFSMTNSISESGALWLGEHHNSSRDHMLQAGFVRKIHNLRQKKFGVNNGNMSVGLEMVQLQFQPVLDAYISKRITAEEMKEQVQWEKRWSWSFDNYLPVFQTCRELNIPLIALNVDSEDLGLVELGGFPNLSKDKLQKYISDPAGFASFAASPYYKTYVDYVISPSYDLHQQMGILRTTITGQHLDEDMTFSNFFSGRILWDESMASNAIKWNRANEGGLIIGLVGADHVKFQCGITGRYQRMAIGNQLNCISAILNPSLIDTRPSGTVSIASNSASAASATQTDGLTLQLRYLKSGIAAGTPESRYSGNTGGVLALADYIVMSR